MQAAHGSASAARTARISRALRSSPTCYISEHAGRDLSKVFDQYLRTTMIPALEYRIEGKTLTYRWADVVSGFDMPIEVTVEGEPLHIQPTEEWQTLPVEIANPEEFDVDSDYYVNAREVAAEER